MHTAMEAMQLQDGQGHWPHRSWKGGTEQMLALRVPPKEPTLQTP